MIRTEDLTKQFVTGKGFLGRKKTVTAVDRVNITITRGKVTAVVGESGSGKSTLARLILRLLPPTSGRIYYDGTDITTKRSSELREFRRKVQVIFQDPFASLNPRMNIMSILSEPLKIHRIMPREQIKDFLESLLESVGLSADVLNRYPHEFSGGQRQRISIARALTLSPELIIADEPLSSLDVSIQAQILNLLNSLREEKGISFLFISHDLNVVRYFSDYIYVMYLGRVVEAGLSDVIFENPAHPYTLSLLAAVPGSGMRKKGRHPAGEPDGPVHAQEGCPFYPRCPERLSICNTRAPELIEGSGRLVACHLQQ